MSLKGSPQRLRDIARDLGAMPVTVAQAIATRCAPALTDLALASFDAGTDAYGAPWAPGYDGREVDLLRSGALRGGVSFVAIGRRVRCKLGARHAKYQVGKRAILPAPGQTMPGAWSAAAATITREECSRALGGRAA